MHVVVLNYVFEMGLATGGILLKRFHALTGWAEALRAAGISVTVFQRFWRDEETVLNGVKYHFISDHNSPHLARWQIPVRLHRRATLDCRQNLANGKPVVVHLNSLIFPLQKRHLRAVLPRRCAIVAQHHAERPAGGLRRLFQRWGLAAMDGFLFSDLELSHPWQYKILDRREQDIFAMMAGSTGFHLQDRRTARQRTGIYGKPVFLWVGQLSERKDPLTVLTGFETILSKMPEARFYMIYQEEQLLAQVTDRIENSQVLRQAVSLLGPVDHDHIEAYYNSADYFVLGSHTESFGFALVEALACGVVPVVTDIPTFRRMTDNGRLGELWLPGQAGSLGEAIQKAVQRPLFEESLAARQYFESQLSYPALGQQARAIYKVLFTRRQEQFA